MDDRNNRAPHRVAIDLIRSLISNDIDTARAIVVNQNNDLNGLCPSLVRWRMAGYLYVLIRNASLTRSVPPQVLRVLEDSYGMQVRRSGANVKLLEEVQQNLAAASVSFLTLKGLYLAQRFFGDVRNRFMWDVDILVRHRDLATTISVIEDMGLKLPSGYKFDPENRFWGIHAIEARGEAGKIDIHHAIRTLPNISFDQDSLWNHGQEFTIGEAKFRTVSDEDTLLTATIGLATDLQSGHHRIRKIFDVYMMLREMDSSTDWERFLARREKDGSLVLILNMFSFCMLLLKAGRDSPNLQAVMTNYNQLLLITGEQQADRIYIRGRQHIANRILFSRLLPVSPWRYWMNWLISLPARSWHFRK
jgi:hypothetical protein